MEHVAAVGQIAQRIGMERPPWSSAPRAAGRPPAGSPCRWSRWDRRGGRPGPSSAPASIPCPRLPSETSTNAPGCVFGRALFDQGDQLAIGDLHLRVAAEHARQQQRHQGQDGEQPDQVIAARRRLPLGRGPVGRGRAFSSFHACSFPSMLTSLAGSAKREPSLALAAGGDASYNGGVPEAIYAATHDRTGQECRHPRLDRQHRSQHAGGDCRFRGESAARWP